MRVFTFKETDYFPYFYRSKLFTLIDISHSLNTSYKEFRQWLISEFCNNDYDGMRDLLSEKLRKVMHNRDSDLVDSIKRHNLSAIISVDEQIERVYSYR